MNNFLEKLVNLPRNTLDEQVLYWETLNYELAMFKINVHKSETEMIFKIMKKDYPTLFKDFQLLHKANKEILSLIIS